MRSLFETDNKKHKKNMYAPLAERMRPNVLDDFVGQEEIVGQGAPLRKMIESDNISSMIFWGPPGTGKTTLARIIANSTDSVFRQLSAVTSGINDIKKVFDEAAYNKALGKKTILFVDEIHRFNKTQQDAFLPFVESGEITLIGATTENPSFEVNSALLSRTKVYVLKALEQKDIMHILDRAIKNDEELKSKNIKTDEDCLAIISKTSNGDARSALNTLENVVSNIKMSNGSTLIEKNILKKLLGNKTFLYDKKGEWHYNLISALHKSMRNSDPNAALYYLARMLEAGEDPLYVARRLVRFASEDIGLANNNALLLATAAYQAAHFNGMPECNVNLAQAVVYLSVCPKSNALYKAYGAAARDAKATAGEPVPLDLCNAVTDLMEDIGYGKHYQYAHDDPNKVTNMQCFPDELVGSVYYVPTDQGKEKAIGEAIKKIEELKKKKGGQDDVSIIRRKNNKDKEEI